MELLLLDELLRRLDPLDELLLLRLELPLELELRSLPPERERCACALVATSTIAASDKQIANAIARTIFRAETFFIIVGEASSGFWS